MNRTSCLVLFLGGAGSSAFTFSTLATSVAVMANNQFPNHSLPPRLDPRSNAVELGDSRKFDCWRSGVAGGGVRVAFDEVTVVAGSFDDAWA
ncbi:hypothetical protein, partial [Frankia tisae]|uniref:hypothetical protein n=1 Tax=Frankia tisae TaxID=2950104 RepID=UPI0021C25269